MRASLTQNLYESIKNEPFKIPEDDGNDLTHTFFNPDREGWLLKLGKPRPGCRCAHSRPGAALRGGASVGVHAVGTRATSRKDVRASSAPGGLEGLWDRLRSATEVVPVPSRATRPLRPGRGGLVSSPPAPPLLRTGQGPRIHLSTSHHTDVHPAPPPPSASSCWHLAPTGRVHGKPQPGCRAPCSPSPPPGPSQPRRRFCSPGKIRRSTPRGQKRAGRAETLGVKELGSPRGRG